MISGIRVVLFLAVRQLLGRLWINLLAAGGVLFGVASLLAVVGALTGWQDDFMSTILRVSPHIVITDRPTDSDPNLLQDMRAMPVVTKVLHATGPAGGQHIRNADRVVRAIQRMGTVVGASGVVTGSVAILANGEELPVELYGIDPIEHEQVIPFRQYMVTGTIESLAEVSDGALIGSILAKRIHVEVGDTITCTAFGGRRITLSIVGIFDTAFSPVDGGRIIVSQAIAQSVLGKVDAIDKIEVRLKDGNAAGPKSVELEELFGYVTKSWQQEQAAFLALFKQENYISLIIIAALMLVGGFCILAVQVMTVMQKRRDIAILRSVGFSATDVVLSFLLQGACVAAVGAVLGDVAGHFALAAIGSMHNESELCRSEYYNVRETVDMYLWATGFAIFVGVVASAVPAIRASKVEPVDVLRGQI